MPSLPPRMSLGIKTAPNPFHGAARPAVLNVEPMSFSIPKQKLNGSSSMKPSRPAVSAGSAATDWRALTQPQIRVLTNMPKLPAGVIYPAPLLLGPGDEELIQRDRSAVHGLCGLFLNLQVADKGEASVILDEIAGRAPARLTRSIKSAALRLFPVTVTSGER